VLGQQAIGYIEVETFGDTGRLPRTAGWADVGNLHISGACRRRGVGSWLLGQAADWLELAHVDRLLDYAPLEDTDSGGLSYEGYRAFLAAAGFRELARAERGWTRQ
jgi:GNAT superfamily N-acetyltransferase